MFNLCRVSNITTTRYSLVITPKSFSFMENIGRLKNFGTFLSFYAKVKKIKKLLRHWLRRHNGSEKKSQRNKINRKFGKFMCEEIEKKQNM